MLDRLGTLFATLCPLHCAAVPVVLATSSSFMLALLSWKDPRHDWAMALLRLSAWEAWAVVAALALAAACIAIGYRAHRRAAPAWLLCGAALSFAAALHVPLQSTPLVRSAFAVIGGTLLVISHSLNARAIQRVTPRI